MPFTWDPAKAEVNRRKHGVDFADSLSRVLTVVYTWRTSAIRIISARKATARERAQYER